MHESKNFIKLATKQRHHIEKLLNDNLIGYHDNMYRMDSLMKLFQNEVEVIKKCHGQDFATLTTEINSTKDPIKKVIERATIENDNIIKELERTQKNNRTLINEYLKNVGENKNTQSQVNLFCSVSSEEMNSTYYNQKSQRTVYFPKVFSAMTSTMAGDETS